MRKTVFVAILGIALALPGFAQMGGGGMGGDGMGGGGMGGDGDHQGGGSDDMGGGGMGSGAMMGGGGMVVIADDGSVLLTEDHASMGDETGDDASADLVNIGVGGGERWRVAFADGQPMMALTAGALVVVNVVEQGDHEEGEDDDSHDGDMGGGGMGHGASTLVGLDLASGEQVWTFSPEEPSMLMPQISKDGSLVLVVATKLAEAGDGSTHQGNGGFGKRMASTLYALDNFGNLLWSLDLGTK